MFVLQAAANCLTRWRRYISDPRMRLCIDKCPEFVRCAAAGAPSQFSVSADTPLFLATLIPDHDFQLGCDTDVSRSINKRLEEDGPQLRRQLAAFAATGDDTARGRAEAYLWQLLEEIEKIATKLSPQEVFKQRCATGRVLLLI